MSQTLPSSSPPAHREADESALPASARLAESEDRYRAIFEGVSDGLTITELASGRLVEANAAFCRMQGASREELLGKRPTEWIHPDDLHLFGAYLRAVGAGGEFRSRARNIRKDGTICHVEVRGTPFTYFGRPHVLGVVRDVTEQVGAYQLLEARVAERTRELAALLEVSRNVASTLELRPLLRLIVEKLRTVVPHSAAAVFLIDGADTLALLDYQGPLAEERLQRRWSLREAAHSKAVVDSRAPVIIPDVWADTPLARAFRATAVQQLGAVPADIGSWMATPLLSHDRVIGVLSFDHGETGFYTARHAELALAFANQAATAIENARLFERIQAAAATEERQKLARELHDSVSQALYGIALGARTARAQLDRDPAQVAEPLDYVLSLAQAGLAEMRALIFELRPESLASEGIVAALTKQAEALRARHGLTVHADLDAEPEAPLPAKEALYRIAQEALHNVVKHARATDVRLTLRQVDGDLLLEVADDGAGFDPTAAFPGHLGLRSMRERAAQAGGTLQIESAPGAGTRLRVVLPIRL